MVAVTCTVHVYTLQEAVISLPYRGLLCQTAADYQISSDRNNVMF